MAYLLKGYKALSVTQVVNIFVIGIRNLDDHDAIRQLLAYLYLEAKQEATERTLEKTNQPVCDWSGPATKSLRKLTGGRKSIEGLWRRLEELQLISRSGGRIRVTETPLHDTCLFLELVCGTSKSGEYIRSAVRPVPIPHEWLREWAKPTRKKVISLLHLFYCAACLSFKNQTSGEVKFAATFKFEKLIRLSLLRVPPRFV